MLNDKSFHVYASSGVFSQRRNSVILCGGFGNMSAGLKNVFELEIRPQVCIINTVYALIFYSFWFCQRTLKGLLNAKWHVRPEMIHSRQRHSSIILWEKWDAEFVKKHFEFTFLWILRNLVFLLRTYLLAIDSDDFTCTGDKTIEYCDLRTMKWTLLENIKINFNRRKFCNCSHGDRNEVFKRN